MSRLKLILAVVGGVLVAALGAYLWWTLPPAADGAALAAALGQCPTAEGRVAIAEPRRAARWLLRHRQALALLALAAPEARASLPRLQPMLLPLLDGAQGPLTAWWSGRDLAVGTRLRPGAARAAAVLAAHQGLACDAGAEMFRVATNSSLLAAPQRVATPPAAGERLAALAEVAGRTWRLAADRDLLDARTGGPVDAPATSGPSWIETRDATALLHPFGVQLAGGPGGTRAVFAEGSGWAAAVPAAGLPRFVRDALDLTERALADGSPHPWSGLLGDVWIRAAGDRLLVATSETLLVQVEPPAAGEAGRVTGRDITWLAGDLAKALERLPLLDREARSLRGFAGQVEGLGAVSWRATQAGARVELEW